MTEHWTKKANCKHTPKDIFFPDRCPRVQPPPSLIPKPCIDCPVAKECHNEAITHGLIGWWGGRLFNRLGEELPESTNPYLHAKTYQK